MTLKNARVYQALLRRLPPSEALLSSVFERRIPRAAGAAGRDPQRPSSSRETNAPPRVWSQRI